MWIKVNSEPPIGFYSMSTIPLGSPHISYPLLSNVGTISRRLNDEVPNLTVIIDNSDNLMTDLFSIPCLGSRVTLYNDKNSSLFEGSITRIRLADQVELTIEG